MQTGVAAIRCRLRVQDRSLRRRRHDALERPPHTVRQDAFAQQHRVQKLRFDPMLHAGLGFPGLLFLIVAAADDEGRRRVATQTPQTFPLYQTQHARHECGALPE